MLKAQINPSHNVFFFRCEYVVFALNAFEIGRRPFWLCCDGDTSKLSPTKKPEFGSQIWSSNYLSRM